MENKIISPSNDAGNSIEEIIKSEHPTIKNPGETPPNPLSKRQIKKQKKLEEYRIIRQEKRIKERERHKQKRQLAVSQGLPAQNGPTRKELKKRQETFDENAASVKIAIDLDFDDIMSEHDMAKCVKQTLRIYTINRRSSRPGKIYFTGIKTNGRIHQALKRHDGWENWRINYNFDKTHLDVFDKDKIVYLTCESDNVLESIDSNIIYIIGGLVDHNHQKGLCHERATSAGIKTARLPLSEHVDMKTRSVLSTFHVFEVLLRVAGGSNWTNAILDTIPVRKGAKPKKDFEPAKEQKDESKVQPEVKSECELSKIVNT